MGYTRASGHDGFMDATIDHLYKQGAVQDAITESNILLNWLKAKGRVEKISGGSGIEVNVMSGLNTTFGSFGPYDTLNAAAQNGFTRAQYTWARYACLLVLDKGEMDMNSGKEKIISVLKEKVTQLVGTTAEGMNEDLWAIEYPFANGTTGNAGKDIISVPMLCVNDPGNNISTVGVIAAGTSPAAYWSPKNKDVNAVTTHKGFQDKIRSAINDCSRGPFGGPDMAIGGQDAWEVYVSGLDTKVRYADTNSAKAGFETIRLSRGCEFGWDYMCPDAGQEYDYDSASATKDSIFLLNSKAMGLKILAGKDFKPGKFIEPADQDTLISKHIFRGQLIANNRRKLGCVENIQSSSIA